MKNINLIAFGTFGSPNGFTQTFFLGNPIKGIKAFDLRGILKLLPNSEIYSIRKENVDGLNLLSYSKYTFALEPTSSRGGSFIGSSIMFIDKISEENITIKNLKEFHQNLIAKNVDNETIKVKHSNEFDVSECKPKDFDKINYHLKEVENLNFSQNRNKDLVVLSRISDDILQQNLRKSLILLNNYDTIYFTDNIEIAELTKSKGIYKTIDETGFDSQINNILEERKRKREQYLMQFSDEIRQINDVKKRTIEEYKKEIEESKKIHSLNAEKLSNAEKDIDKITKFFDNFLNDTNQLIYTLKNSNSELEDIKRLHNENKINFNRNIPEFKKAFYFTKIEKPKPKGNLQTENPEYYTKSKNRETEKKNKQEIESTSNKEWNQINLYKVATFILVFILLSTWVYIWFFDSKSEEKIELNQNENNEHSNLKNKNKPLLNLTTPDELDPKPNSILNNNDFRIVANKIYYNSKVEDIVKIIFNLNPTDINKSYSNQEKIYSDQLVFLNKQCFEEKDGNYYFVKDTIRNIPSFKKSF